MVTPRSSFTTTSSGALGISSSHRRIDFIQLLAICGAAVMQFPDRRLGEAAKRQARNRHATHQAKRKHLGAVYARSKPS